MNDYKEAFSNLAKAMEDFDPTTIGREPSSTPPKVNVESETLSIAESFKTGTIAGRASKNILDTKDHFPVLTETQAQASMSRVMQVCDLPGWYRGTIATLRQEVYEGIMATHPNIKLSVRVPAEQVVALSDGEEGAETSPASVEDPNKVQKSEVPQVSRPTLTSARQLAEACQDEEDRKAIAGRLMEMLGKQEEHLSSAIKIGGRLLKSGVSAEEFDALSTFLQEDTLRELMQKGTTAQSMSRRQELLERMNRKDV